jgi:ABC-type lipopolysaccharide export system ATPase subunit
MEILKNKKIPAWFIKPESRYNCNLDRKSEVIILDEPFANLDPTSVNRLKN